VPTSLQLYLLLVGLVAVERLVELRISARNTRRALAAGASESGQAHFPAMALLHAAFLACCCLEVVALQRPWPGAIGWSALAGVLLAQAVRYWVVATLGPRWSVRVVTYPEGHPAGAPITTGPYRYLRHPNYLAVIVELVCLPLVHGAWGTALLFSALNGGLLALRIRVEEKALGSRYRQRFDLLPRLLPRWARPGGGDGPEDP
jgi:methyltransferase